MTTGRINQVASVHDSAHFARDATQRMSKTGAEAGVMPRERVLGNAMGLTSPRSKHAPHPREHSAHACHESHSDVMADMDRKSHFQIPHNPQEGAWMERVSQATQIPSCR